MKRLTITLLTLLVLGGCAPQIMYLEVYDPRDQNALDNYKKKYGSLDNFKASAVGSYLLKGEVEEVTASCSGKSSQEEANTCALIWCNNYTFGPRLWFPFKDKGSEVSCLIDKEGDKDVYQASYQARLAEEAQTREKIYQERLIKEEKEAKKEEEKRQAYITELTNRCISFGFEETNTIASCLQQEIFNEKKLALLSKPTYVVKKDKEKDVSWWEKILIEATDPERIEKVRLENRVRALESQRRAPIIINKQ